MSFTVAPTAKPRTSVPVAPGKLPVLGHALNWRRNPIDFIRSLRSDGTDIVKVYMGPVPVYFVLDHELVYQILVGGAAGFDKGRLFDKLRGAIGNGLINSDGAFHLRQRRLMQPVFHRTMLDIYARVMTAKAQETAARLNAGDVVDMQQEADDLSLEIAVCTLFSADIGVAGRNAVVDCLPVILRSVIKRTVLPEFLVKLPTPGMRRLKKADRTLHDVVQKVIDAYRADGEDHGDLLSVLIAAHDDETGSGMTDQQLHDEVLTLMLAATEGSSAVLAALLHRLAENPDVETRVLAEIDEVLGGRTIQVDDITRLGYLANVLAEVLRLDPPTDVIMRRTTKELTLGGVVFPAGTELAFSAPTLHRDPRVFEDPLTFDPDRWERTPLRSLPRGAYVPFGVGVRQCIGNAYALTELTVVAVTLLSKWKFAVAPGTRPEQLHRATTHFKNLMMTVEPRVTAADPA
jgi:cytochrome P450